MSQWANDSDVPIPLLRRPLQTFFGELEGAEDGASLVHALVVFAPGSEPASR